MPSVFFTTKIFMATFFWLPSKQNLVIFIILSHAGKLQNIFRKVTWTWPESQYFQPDSLSPLMNWAQVWCKQHKAAQAQQKCQGLEWSHNISYNDRYTRECCSLASGAVLAGRILTWSVIF